MVGDDHARLRPGGLVATFAWTGYAEGTEVIKARRRTVTATLGPVREVSEAPGHARNPRVVVDGAGKATIAFLHEGGPVGLAARSLTPSGALSPLRDIDGP